MSSWYSSWFSGLPSFDFAVPSSIQRRFFSFLLKRTLGHFLKPGQLNLHQIDSQLGSGIVQVKDLELDGQAINQLLLGLPVTLFDGFISGVTARIPFPNPLSSSVGFHVQSLNLTFHITPEQSVSFFSGNSDLTNSVVSVAETFIHDELTPREEAALRQTLRPSANSSPLVDESENLPGGFNPFAYNSHAEEAPKETHGDGDPAGVSVFASLIERLLAKFEFSAMDTKVTVVYPGRASFTLSISEITYQTLPNVRSETSSGPELASEGSDHSGQFRTVSISGLKVTSRELRIATSPTVASTLSPVSFTPQRSFSSNCKPSVSRLSNSSSSLDEDAQLTMSQSVALLPPPSPHLSSASSSMYQSAVSATYARSANVDITSASLYIPQVTDTTDNYGRARQRPRISIPCRDSAEDVLLSFGSQPISFSLQTPHHTQISEQSTQVGIDSSVNPDTLEQETLRLSVTIGTLACAFRSGHLRLLLDIVDAFVSKLPASSLVPRKEASSEPPYATLCLEANIMIRGIVMIALPESSTGYAFPLESFYERPLVPPKLSCTYLRLSLDALSIDILFSTPSPHLSSVPRATSSVPADQSVSARLVISDVSLFTFHALSSIDDSHIATPILITDHYLPLLHLADQSRPSLTSERPSDMKLPKFEVVDWTQAKFRSGSAKLSMWRSKNQVPSGKAGKSHTPSLKPSDLPGSPNPFVPSPLSEADDTLSAPSFVEVFGRVGPPFPSKSNSRTIDVNVAPLHLFIDLGMVFKEELLPHFVDDIASATIFMPRKTTDMVGSELFRQGNSDEDDVNEEDVQFRISHHEREEGGERRRSSRQPVPLHRKKMARGETDVRFRLTCPMIRVEVRCPPPPPLLPRSGCMLFDFRGLTISTDQPVAKSSLRFSEGTKFSLPHPEDDIPNVILTIRMQEVLAAYSTVNDNVAHTILALGFLPTKGVGPDTSALLSAETEPNVLPLSIILGRPNTANASLSSPSNMLSIIVDVPLINLVMEKALLDGIQCWADDVAQLVEHNSAATKSATGTTLSRNPSLIGSRYFTQSRRGTHSTDESVTEKSNPKNTNEMAIKVSVAEVLLRFIVPRNGEARHARPLDISALDVNALIELKPEGNEESVFTAGIMDLRIADTSGDGDYVLLVQSSARSLSSTPRPSMKSRIASFAVPGTTTKESRIKLSLFGFAVHPPLEGGFANDIIVFAKAPPGVFESVVPSECTRLTVSIVDVSAHLRVLGYPGAAVLHLGETQFSTEMMGKSSESAFRLNVSSSHIFLVDSVEDAFGSTGKAHSPLGCGVEFWKNSGYALIAEISHSHFIFRSDNTALPSHIAVIVERIGLRIHFCADTISALTALITNVIRTKNDDADTRLSPITSRTSNTIVGGSKRDMTASLDEHAFRLIPEVGSAADMISDDLPANPDYLDAFFGTAAGLRELRDDDLDDFNMEEQTDHSTPVQGQLGIVSNVGGETIRILKPLSFIEHHFDMISPDTTRDLSNSKDTTLRVRIHDSDIVLSLHDGFDWPRTRKIIEKEIKEMRRKLARIRQLVATGQVQEPIDEATSTTLFNSFHIGLEQDLDGTDPDALIAAIDDELDDSTETGTESSWQSLHPASPGRPATMPARVHGKRLTRSKGPSIEIRLEGVNAEIDNYCPTETLVSRTLILVRDIEILDHIKTSTWKKFLTDMRSDSRGNVRETESNMARVELLSVRPSPSHPAEEARLRAKILPLRLYVDQDALDFLKKFFAFQDPDSLSAPDNGEKKEEIYFQHAEVFPVDIKLDYKPRRVDYRALRDGRTIELMNFFHFDGAEMTLRHLTLHGITGWPRFFDTLNDLWTPDVKATQLVDVISGVSPIRSVVNVGSGVADLVLLPIAQYKKDGRIVRGIQKGTKAFVQSTAMEAIKLGARLATGTQVILEQAESVLGGQFKDSVTAEALQIPYENEDAEGSDEDLISRYAAQPTGLKEGVQSAYRSLQKNLHSAAQTILAVPMEVYERSGNEGAVKAVVRAVPIAVLKPMIGASEAVSKTLMGLHNTLDPNIRLENEAKYKHR